MKNTIINDILFPSLTLSFKISLDLLIGASVSNEFNEKGFYSFFLAAFILSTTMHTTSSVLKKTTLKLADDSWIEIVVPLISPYLANYLQQTTMTSCSMHKHQSFGILIELMMVFSITKTIIHLNWIRRNMNHLNIEAYFTAIPIA